VAGQLDKDKQNVPNTSERDSLPPEDIFAQRMAKLGELEDAGINPFGGRYDGASLTAEVRSGFEEGGDEEARFRVAGRLTAFRVMGKSIFADVRDSSGRLQIYVKKDALGEDGFRVFKRLDIGDIVGVEGTMFVTRTGEPTLKVDAFVLLSKSLRSLPEKWHGLTDVEARYRQRHLDLISNEDSKRVFLQRFAIIRGIRAFLESRDFLEVETPMMQAIPGGASAKPFETFHDALGVKMYLRIAPELYLKRLLVGGFEKVFELNRNFRNEGLSRRHNPEFTMIEIYQAYGDCRTMMELVEELVTTVAQNVVGTLEIERSDGGTIKLERPWRRVAYKDLVKEKCGGDWFEISPAERAGKAAALGLKIEPGTPDFEVTNEVYEKLIEPTLIQPTFVTRLPKELVPLAKACDDDPDLVDVFELEINGQEIAPGYSELNDPVEQRRRFEAQIALGGDDSEGKIDEEFLAAMEQGMPPAGGMGIGIDRLVMAITGADSIRDVILFPQMRSKNN